MFCQYKDIFGPPNTGFHSTRLFGLAANDLIGTIIIALTIAYFNKLNYVYTILITFIFVIFIHRLFCVNTALNVALLGEVNS